MSTEQNNNQQQNTKEQKAGCWQGCIWFIVFAIAIALIIFITGSITDCAKKNKDDDNSEPEIFERAATTNDIDFDYSIEALNLSVKIYIIPKVNINNLSLDIKFYDADYNKIKTLIKPLGNVEEGERTEFTISLAEFSISQILTINYVSWNIESGTVYIFS